MPVPSLPGPPSRPRKPVARAIACSPKCLGLACLLWIGLLGIRPGSSVAQEPGPGTRTYSNRLTLLENPPPLLAEFPQFVAPVREERRYEAPALIADEGGDLHVRAWRFSYNARAIVEMPNILRARETAVIFVHPWGIDDGQGWRTPEPAGAADFCTPAKNHLAGRHTTEVINPLLNRLRPHVAGVIYSLRGDSDPLRRRLYRSLHGDPDLEERRAARQELSRVLNGFPYEGQPLPTAFPVSTTHPVHDYFRAFPGLDASPRYNQAGFWDLPVPVSADVAMEEEDTVIFDGDGYEMLRDHLRAQGVRHVLLTGYATDMCFCSTTAGYQNLSRDFNVILVGDATLATFPANASPAHATNAAISLASLNHLITQASWIQLDDGLPAGTLGE